MASGAELFAAMGAKPKSYGDFRQEIDSQNANALALKAGGLQYQNALQAAQEDAAYKDAARTFGSDQTANYNALMQRGLPKQAQALQAATLGNQKTQAEIGHLGAQTASQNAAAGKTAVEAAAAKLGYGQKVLQSASNPQQVAMLMSQAVQGGIYSQQEAAAFLNDMPADPTKFVQWRDQQAMQGMEIGKKLELQIKQKDSEAQNANRDLIPDGQGGWKVNAPLVGAKTQIAQASASSINNFGSPVAGVDAEGKPVFFQPTKTGGAPAIVPGVRPPKDPNADKPLTEDQGKATTFASRMRSASQTIDRLEAAGVDSSQLSTKAAGNDYTNVLASPEGQQYRQAQENWVTANLRKESGAVISKDEMNKDIAKWFPKIGDGEAVRAQKARERKVAEEGMLISAGPGAKQVQGVLDRAGVSKQGPKAGAVESGYRFKGGDPADPKNWEKQ